MQKRGALAVKLLIVIAARPQCPSNAARHDDRCLFLSDLTDRQVVTVTVHSSDVRRSAFRYKQLMCDGSLDGLTSSARLNAAELYLFNELP